MSVYVPAARRKRIAADGARRALRAAISNIEKLGINHADFDKVKACLVSMIDDLTEPA